MALGPCAVPTSLLTGPAGPWAAAGRLQQEKGAQHGASVVGSVAPARPGGGFSPTYVFLAVWPRPRCFPSPSPSSRLESGDSGTCARAGCCEGRLYELLALRLRHAAQKRSSYSESEECYMVARMRNLGSLGSEAWDRQNVWSSASRILVRIWWSPKALCSY